MAKVETKLKVFLLDGESEISTNFIDISENFKNEMKLNIKKVLFEKIKQFGEFYLSLDKKEQKLFDHPINLNLWNDNINNFYNNHLICIAPTDLVEIANTVFELKFTAMTNITAFLIANNIKNKTPEELRKTFNIINDFTPEEEENIKKEIENFNIDNEDLD